MSDFTKQVKDIVRKIPKGEVMTYSEVAQKTDSPKAIRAVASTMAKNFDSDIPCHRVIKSDGTAGKYNRGGESAKRRLLAAEGVVL